MRPPTTLNVNASIKNCARTSRPRAPTAQAQADFARAFRDRHEHDVHDADAADDQRYRGDAGEQRRQRIAGLLERARHLLRRNLIELRKIREHEDGGRGVQALDNAFAASVRTVKSSGTPSVSDPSPLPIL